MAGSIILRRAVVHVNLDARGDLSVAALERAVAALRADGFEVIASDLDKLPAKRREIELLHSGDDPDELRRAAEAACVAALARSGAGATPRAVAVSFISTGSEEDARGVVRAFGLGEQLREITFEDEDVAIFVLERDTVPAKLQTVLEAALNREVRFVTP